MIVPCFNEEASILAVLDELKSSPENIDVVVVNDGSTDRSAAIVGGLNDVMLLDLPFNLGIGGAVQAGFRFFLSRDYDVAVQFDADGQHSADQIPDLVQPLAQGHDVVIGSRFLEPTSSGFRSTGLRRMGIWSLRSLLRIISGSRILDVTSGFRALSREAVRKVIDDYPDDYPEPVSIMLFLRKNLSICEVPVVMRSRSGGRSSIAGKDNFLYMFKVTTVILASWLNTARRKA